jgi:hypothetical protein
VRDEIAAAWRGAARQQGVLYVRERIKAGYVMCGENVEIRMVVTMQDGGTRGNHGSENF